jgi:putative DNA primase/helicase
MSASDFGQALLSFGMELRDPVLPEGRIRRAHMKGDKRASRNGWYVLNRRGDRLWGAFGDNKTGRQLRWSSYVEPIARGTWVSAARADACRSDIDDLRQLWETSSPANPAHPYLVRKGVGVHGIRHSRGALLIPVRKIDGTLTGLQRIYPDGTKRFAKGSRKKGAMHVLGSWNDPVLIAEGYATASSCFEATGYCTIVAFDAGNLDAVGKAIRNAHPNVRIYFIADDDPNGVGERASAEAARNVNGSVVNPSIYFKKSGYV